MIHRTLRTTAKVTRQATELVKHGTGYRELHIAPLSTRVQARSFACSCVRLEKVSSDPPSSTPAYGAGQAGSSSSSSKNSSLASTELLTVLEETIKVFPRCHGLKSAELTQLHISSTDARTTARISLHDIMSSPSYPRLLHNAQGFWLQG